MTLGRRYQAEAWAPHGGRPPSAILLLANALMPMADVRLPAPRRRYRLMQARAFVLLLAAEGECFLNPIDAFPFRAPSCFAMLTQPVPSVFKRRYSFEASRAPRPGQLERVCLRTARRWRCRGRQPGAICFRRRRDCRSRPPIKMRLRPGRRLCRASPLVTLTGATLRRHLSSVSNRRLTDFNDARASLLTCFSPHWRGRLSVALRR